MKILVNNKGDKFYWTSGDLHTKYGMIKEAELKKKSQTIETHTGKKFTVFEAKLSDKVTQLKKGPAVLNVKDIGLIIAKTGINSKSKVVDAGAGGGILAGYLGNIAEQVTTYEKHEQHYKIAKENLKAIAPKVKIKKKDITEGVDETKLDLITLDLPNPWDALIHAASSLVSGAYLVCYLPQITQVTQLIKEAENHNFILEEVTELIKRDWKVHDKVCRPEHNILGHTAFLVFLRKY